MSWALLGLSIGLASLVAYLVYKAISGKDGQLADRTEALAQRERADGLEADRDREHAARTVAEEQLADATSRLAAAEAHIADLSAKLARVITKRVAEQPASQDGADAVNDLFAKPIGDGLEKS